MCQDIEEGYKIGQFSCVTVSLMYPDLAVRYIVFDGIRFYSVSKRNLHVESVSSEQKIERKLNT